MTNQKPRPSKGFWKKLWWFIWEDNSVWSWIVNIILAFVLIKFIVYPGLGFALGTTHPIVAVVSGSMEQNLGHPCAVRNPSGICVDYNKNLWEICGNTFEEKQSIDRDSFWQYCGGWYTENTDIVREDFEEFRFKNGFNKGDIMILSRPTNIEVGDVVVFGSNQFGDPIIHRVVSVSEDSVATKGDHNNGQAEFEKTIPQEQLIGKAQIRVPWLGWIKIGFVSLIS
jgi:signal peptidase I